MHNIESYLNTNPILVKAVVGFPVQDGKVILGFRKKISMKWGKNIYSGIGGKVGDKEEWKNESNEEALNREFVEECGIEIVNSKFCGVVNFLFPDSPEYNMETYIYLIDKWNGEAVETEVIRPELFPVDNLPLNEMWEDNKHWVPYVLNSAKNEKSNTKVYGNFLYESVGEQKFVREVSMRIV